MQDLALNIKKKKNCGGRSPNPFILISSAFRSQQESSNLEGKVHLNLCKWLLKKILMPWQIQVLEFSSFSIKFEAFIVGQKYKKVTMK